MNMISKGHSVDLPENKLGGRLASTGYVEEFIQLVKTTILAQEYIFYGSQLDHDVWER